MLRRFLCWFRPLPLPRVRKPVFILGCGRSGTTILGESLSKHAKVTHLNEPRHLWVRAFPETDIWSDRAVARNGRLWLDATDATEPRSRKLQRMFALETFLARRPVLVEKLPINSFRLGLIHAVFPDARFLHIHRNGLEVARSIAKLAADGRWFGNNGYKWQQLVAHAAKSEATAGLPKRCSTSAHKGLLEWRLSTEAAVTFLAQVPQQNRFELSYRDFSANPENSMVQIQTWLGLEDSPAVRTFVQEQVALRTTSLDGQTPTDLELALGGQLLRASQDAGIRDLAGLLKP